MKKNSEYIYIILIFMVMTMDMFYKYKYKLIQTNTNININKKNDIFNINKKNDIFIIYYIFINPNNNWKDIIIGQLKDIKDSGIICNTFHNINLLILLSSCSMDNINDAIAIINDFFKDIAFNKYNIKTTNDNLYEYPGIFHLYTKGVENPDALLLYFHSKGMSFHNNVGRITDEIKLTRYMLFYWKKIINIFNDKKHINKISLACSDEGWGWFNFFWVRGSYLKNCDEPIITDYRYYYESWLGRAMKNSSYTDCYNLLTPDVPYYKAEDAAHYLHNLEIITQNDIN
jgi:hypothetical protein